MASIGLFCLKLNIYLTFGQDRLDSLRDSKLDQLTLIGRGALNSDVSDPIHWNFRPLGTPAGVPEA